jgi:hypothetical protein
LRPLRCAFGMPTASFVSTKGAFRVGAPPLTVTCGTASWRAAQYATAHWDRDSASEWAGPCRRPTISFPNATV